MNIFLENILPMMLPVILFAQGVIYIWIALDETKKAKAKKEAEGSPEALWEQEYKKLRETWGHTA